MDAGASQVFTVTINWSAEPDVRLTEGDIREVIEDMVAEIDEDAEVDVAERLE